MVRENGSESCLAYVTFWFLGRCSFDPYLIHVIISLSKDFLKLIKKAKGKNHLMKILYKKFVIKSIETGAGVKDIISL